METPVRIELFDGLRVCEEIAHSWPGTTKASALLAYLAYRLDRPHSREELIELLWPESDPDAGRNRLNVTFSRLRQELASQVSDPESLFLSDRHRIGLRRDRVHTDVAEFHACLS